MVCEIKEKTGLFIADLELFRLKELVEEDGVCYIAFLFHTNKYTSKLTSSYTGNNL